MAWRSTSGWRTRHATATRPRSLLDEAADELAAATQELRELARGIHPADPDRARPGARAARARRGARLPIELTVALAASRRPTRVEAAAYFVVAEALTNVARYAEATTVRGRVQRPTAQCVVEVRDDGVGGADPARGTGLRGLADRVAALDGRSHRQPARRGHARPRGDPCAS